jgi:subtilisin family serine protease
VGYVNNKRTYDYSDDTVALLSCKEDKIRYPKPDLVTLGVDVLSLDYKKIDGYTKKSGSSMATAIVSGVSALLIEKYSDSNVSEIESILKDGTIYLENSEPSSQGKGELCFLRKNAKTPIP